MFRANGLKLFNLVNVRNILRTFLKDLVLINCLHLAKQERRGQCQRPTSISCVAPSPNTTYSDNNIHYS